MKKKTTKTTKAKSAAVRSVNVRVAHHGPSWSMSIYVYWFIILFFIAATFFILGRSQFTSESRGGLKNGIAEEVLLRANDYYNQGKEEILAGNLDGAIADLTSAITTDGNMVSAYILRGEAYMQAGDYRAALNDFNSAIELDSQNSVAYYDRSLLNTRLEDFESAMTDINNALATYAANPNEFLQMRDLYAKRGQLNLWQKNWEGAIADYTNSLARPEGIVSPSVYAERAEAYTAMGNYADAVNDYTSAIRVISEQIQGATTIEQKEDLSMRAMNYFEKSAALNLSMGNAAAARSDLESAYQIATSLNDAETVERFQGLLEEME